VKEPRPRITSALEHAHRIVAAEHRDRGAEADLLGTRRDGREHDLRCGDREVVAMVLAHTDEVQTQAVGQHTLVHHVADHLMCGHPRAVEPHGDVTEGVESEFQRRHVHVLSSPPSNILAATNIPSRSRHRSPG
jgi:hypothetical protein